MGEAVAMPVHAVEQIPGEEWSDDLARRRRFYVYVLATDRGHYVGHTGRPDPRLREHLRDRCRSTRGTNPKRVWLSEPMETRKDAKRMEATLKTWRDQRSERFLEMIGELPQPLRVKLGDG